MITVRARADRTSVRPARARRWWLRPGRTLRGRLTTGLVAVLLIACAVLGAATVLFLRTFLIERLDTQLTAAGGRYSASLERGQGGPGGSDGDADNAVPGQSTGTLGVRLAAGKVTQAAVVTDDGANRGLTLDREDTARVIALGVGGPPATRHLDALGDYRLKAVAGRDGDVQITGLPLHAIDETLARLAAVEAAVFALVVLAGGLATRFVVRHTLRPLEQVTATALHVSELPLTDADAEFPTSIAPAEPTSEVDQVSVAFDHMLAHVRGALTERDATEARLRRFIADASHELRTPLAAVRAHAEFASRHGGGPIPEAARQSLERITAAAERMGVLVGDLLLLARLDAGRPLARETVDLTRLVLDAVTDARAAAPAHRWRIDVPQEAVSTVGDNDRLHQVLTNLLTNAGAHTPPGTTVTTALSVDVAADQVEIAVHDDGPGIPLAAQAELFDRFTRGDTSRSREHGSTGLGLAIASGIAGAHHGTLTVTSAPGAGTSFRLRLPFTSPPPAGARRVSTDRESADRDVRPAHRSALAKPTDHR